MCVVSVCGEGGGVGVVGLANRWDGNANQNRGMLDANVFQKGTKLEEI